jgi:hypothetical protein
MPMSTSEGGGVLIGSGGGQIQQVKIKSTIPSQNNYLISFQPMAASGGVALIGFGGGQIQQVKANPNIS